MAEMHRGRPLLLRAALLALGAGLTAGTVSSSSGLARDAVPTFSADVAPLVYRKCGPCHHPGGAGPFSLLDYDDVFEHARDIRKLTGNRFMPPWRPAPGVAYYLNDRSLTPAQIDLLARWVDAGAPLGDARAVPPAPSWPGGWQLGQPDLVVQMPQAFELPADGPDVYRNFVIPTPVDRARFVDGWELRTGTRAIHHAILNIDRMGLARARDARDPELGFPGLDPGDVQSPGFFLVWTPGKVPAPRSAETSWRIDEHTDLVLQLHMQPTGKPEHVRPSVALYFSDRPPVRPQFVLRIGDPWIDIAPGDPHYVIRSTYVLPTDVEIKSVFPHAHYLARQVRVWVTLPDGRSADLLRIDNWDFAWQDQYVFAEPVQLPKGSTLGMEFVDDNSPANPRNPSQPPKRVTTGEQSTDEMANVTFEVFPFTPDGMALLRESRYRELLGRMESPRGHYNLANALADLRRTDEAIAEYRRAIELDPGFAMARFNLSTLLSARGQDDAAIEQLRRALAAKPDYLDAHVNLGVALQKKGKLDESIAQLRAAVACDARSAVAHDALGLALEQKRDLAGAAEQLEAGLAIEQDSWLAHYHLGNVLRDEGQSGEAITHYERALELKPDAQGAREALGALVPRH